MINLALMKKLETIPKSSELTIPAGDADIANILKFGMSGNVLTPLVHIDEENNTNNNNENNNQNE